MSDSCSASPASGIALRSAGDQQPPRRLGHRPVLDGLRGVAVLLVVAVHVGLLDSGDIGVDVFFPLSGFLITALLYEEWERHGALSVRRFYARRARRLLPALTMLVVAFAALARLVHTFSATLPKGTLAASTLLFANNWVATLSPAHGRALGPLSPTWSLAQEGQFYLLWPAVLRSCCGGDGGRRSCLACWVYRSSCWWRPSRSCATPTRLTGPTPAHLIEVPSCCSGAARQSSGASGSCHRCSGGRSLAGWRLRGWHLCWPRQERHSARRTWPLRSWRRS